MIKACIARGDNWCPCVADDLPKAEAKLAEGNCSSARHYAIEALKRCHGTPFDIDPGGAGFSVNTDPLPPMDLSAFSFGK